MLSEKNLIKISLSASLIICLFSMPYWYYQIVRILGTIGLVYFAWIDYKESIRLTPILFGFGAILFNPLIKISFDREAWQIIDVAFAFIILGSIVFEKKIYKYLKNG